MRTATTKQGDEKIALTAHFIPIECFERYKPGATNPPAPDESLWLNRVGCGFTDAELVPYIASLSSIDDEDEIVKSGQNLEWFIERVMGYFVRAGLYRTFIGGFDRFEDDDDDDLCFQHVRDVGNCYLYAHRDLSAHWVERKNGERVASVHMDLSDGSPDWETLRRCMKTAADVDN